MINKIELAELLIKRAKEYSKDAQESVVRNRHMNEIEEGEVVQKRHIDAVVVDFINFIGNKMCMDIALYTDDLQEKRVEEESEKPKYEPPHSLLTWEENNT